MEFNKRAIVVVIVVLIFVLLSVGRLVYWQCFKAEDFRFLATNRAIRVQYLPGARGTIFDRNGVAIASNDVTYDLSCVISKLRLDSVNLRYYRRKLSRCYSDKLRLKDDMFIAVEERETRIAELTTRIDHIKALISTLIHKSPTVSNISRCLQIDHTALSDSLVKAFNRVAKGWEYPWSSIVVFRNIDSELALQFATKFSFQQGWEISTSLRRKYTFGEP